MDNWKNRGDQVYNPDGFGRGNARGRIRPLREDEDAEQIINRLEAEVKEAKAKKLAEQQARWDQRDRELNECREWVKENMTYTVEETVVGKMYIVQLPVKDQPAVLVMRFEQQDAFWDEKPKYRANIMVNHQRQSGRIDGGATGATGETVGSEDPAEAAAQWLHSWVGVEAL